jgi:hypothetical protein
MRLLINALESAVWLIGSLGVGYAMVRLSGRRSSGREERR